MALLGSGSPTHFKGMNDKDIEKQLKLLAEEEIKRITDLCAHYAGLYAEANEQLKDMIGKVSSAKG